MSQINNSAQVPWVNSNPNNQNMASVPMQPYGPYHLPQPQFIYDTRHNNYRPFPKRTRRSPNGGRMTQNNDDGSILKELKALQNKLETLEAKQTILDLKDQQLEAASLATIPKKDDGSTVSELKVLLEKFKTLEAKQTPLEKMEEKSGQAHTPSVPPPPVDAAVMMLKVLKQMKSLDKKLDEMTTELEVTTPPKPWYRRWF